MSERPTFRRPGRPQRAGNHIERVLARLSMKRRPSLKGWLVTSKTPRKRKTKRSSRASRHEGDAEGEAYNQDMREHPLAPSDTHSGHLSSWEPPEMKKRQGINIASCATRGIPRTLDPGPPCPRQER